MSVARYLFWVAWKKSGTDALYCTLLGVYSISGTNLYHCFTSSPPKKECKPVYNWLLYLVQIFAQTILDCRFLQSFIVVVLFTPFMTDIQHGEQWLDISCNWKCKLSHKYQAPGKPRKIWLISKGVRIVSALCVLHTSWTICTDFHPLKLSRRGGKY